ncbi:hypothetical protein WA026_010933 [Henosepilachna vigintioctopunctata]|uniref:Trehalase n=1 Tax=Henosepilachna vigintioctopunctata TaxID=420089 RepID=A0AAW1UWE4_9CUCU
MDKLILHILIILCYIQRGRTLTLGCNNSIFCTGPVLHLIQMSKIFADSKTFVDMKMLHSPEEVLENWDNFMEENDQHPSKYNIKKFITQNFNDGDELDYWMGSDYTPTPRILRKIEDLIVRNFTSSIVQIWNKLGRKVKPEVFEYSERYSFIPIPNGFIIPGGRFTELYYWDSYWIVRGLIISEMITTVRGMLENFLCIIDKYGFVPNGSRIYYLSRSQPPVTTIIAGEYIEASKDILWLKKNIKYLDLELRYWLDYKTVKISKGLHTYTLARYISECTLPRPESYSEDIESCEIFDTEMLKHKCYQDLKSTVETGWDFSSRWIFDEQGGCNANVSFSNGKRVIPVDLNSFLCRSFKLMYQFYSIINDDINATFWKNKYQYWKKGIDEIMYNKKDGIWYDYDYFEARQRRYFWPSNLTPLWAEIYDQPKFAALGKAAASYVKRQDLLQYKGGVPASLFHTGEQWDFPHVWAPVQSIVILGLYNSGNNDAKQLAYTFGKRYVEACIKGFLVSGDMYEKYDCREPGKVEGGGEYIAQIGFGWTNGAVLEMINTFYKRN